jgi:hypothetical protein
LMPQATSIGSEQESVGTPVFVGFLESGDIGYTVWHERKRLDEGTRLAWL